MNHQPISLRIFMQICNEYDRKNEIDETKIPFVR